MNLTSRVHVSPPTEPHECVFREAESVVAKYAPAYLAAVGESLPCSQYRQVIEARALALLSQPSLSAYIQSVVTTPRLIHHDPAANILVMSDLGDIPTLDQWLCSESTTKQAAENAGARFGEFLVRLSGISEHVNQDNQKSLNLGTHFANPSVDLFLLSMVVHPLESNLLACGVSPATALLLAKACLEMHERQRQARAKVFGLGDCWPKSLLVEGSGEVSVIDWEFAGMLDPLTDLAQLCANLFLLYQTSPALVKPNIKAYTLAMLHAHHAYCQSTSAWQYAPEYRIDAWRIFGREVVNNVVELYMDWWKGDEGRKRAEAGPLGKMGAGFLKEAEKWGMEEGVLFERVFEGLVV